MAVIQPVADSPAPGVMRITWDACSTGDTIHWYTIPNAWGIAGSVQMYTDSGGAWGSATVTMEETSASDKDGTTTMKDGLGTDVSGTADAKFEVSTTSLFVRPTISGGSGDDVNVILLLRGGIVKT